MDRQRRSLRWPAERPAAAAGGLAPRGRDARLTAGGSSLLLVAAAVALIGGAAAMRGSAAVPGIPAIYVNYNPDCTFTMSVDGGISIGSAAAPGPLLPPGIYQLLVWMPNPNQGYSCGKPTFTLTGPGVSSTTVFQGQELHDEHVLPALQPASTYVAQDASGPSTQKVFTTAASGSNSVLLPSATEDNGTGASTQPGLVGSDIRPSPPALLATVSAAGGATLKLGGTSVRMLKAGTYELHVDDSAPRAGFFLRRGGGKPLMITSLAFVGKRTRAITLSAGRWTYFSKPGRTTSFTVLA